MFTTACSFKTKFVATTMALTLGVTAFACSGKSGGSNAKAHDAAAEIVSGDFVAVAGIDVSTLVQRDAFKLFEDQLKADNDSQEVIGWFKSAGYAYGDIDSVTMFIAAEGADAPEPGAIVFINSKKDTEALKKAALANENIKIEKREHNGMEYFVNSEDGNILIVFNNDKQIIAGSEKEVKATLDSIKSGKPAKPFKNNKALFEQYNAVDKSKDIWVAVAMTPELTNAIGGDEEIAGGIKLSDLNAANLTIHLASGLDLNLDVKTKSNETASSIVTFANALIGSVGAQLINEVMGEGFAQKAITLSAKGDVINAKVTLTKDDVKKLADMAKDD